MGIPAKAIRESTLKKGPRLADGSHEIYPVGFLEEGSIKNGFFKRLDSSYPPLLAYISVAISSFVRACQGNKAAEERLVYDDEDQLVGTLSIRLENFTPLHYANETVPADEHKKAQVIPSTEDLLDYEVIIILCMRFALCDNDGHPHNLGLNGHFDWDMFLYFLVRFIKGDRIGVAPPKTHPNMTTTDYETFPYLGKDLNAPCGDYPFHWATYFHPGEKSLNTFVPGQNYLLPSVLPKVFANPQAFIDLAKSPVARDQKLVGFMRMFITFDPEIQRARLYALLGNASLNYKQCNPSTVEGLEKNFPELCNEKTDKEPFINFIMQVYQMCYDNVYRIVVLYDGCKDNGFGVPMLPTRLALYQKSSIYKDIEEWSLAQNDTTYSSYEPNAKYTKEGLEKRYHQIWRDSFAPELKEILADSHLFVDTLMQLATKGLRASQYETKLATDNTLTTSMEFIGKSPKILVDEHFFDVDPNNPLRKALKEAANFYNELCDLIGTYYSVERQDLKMEDNLTFITGLRELHLRYNGETDSIIRSSLHQTTSNAQSFIHIAQRIELVSRQANFALHRDPNNLQDKKSIESVNVYILDPEEINHRFRLALFTGINRLSPKLFKQKISEVLEKYQTDTYLSARKTFVTSYLKDSKDSQSDILACLLATGSDTSTLNTELIRIFAPLAQKFYPVSNLSEIIFDKNFNADGRYTRVAVDYAKINNQFNNIASCHFFKGFYAWADKNSNVVQNILKSALVAYNKQNSSLGLNFFTKTFNGTRENEVNQFFQIYKTSTALAYTFKKGTIKSTLNRLLFSKIMEHILTTIIGNRHLLQTEKDIPYEIFEKYNASRDLDVLLELMCSHKVTEELVRKAEPAERIQSVLTF